MPFYSGIHLLSCVCVCVAGQLIAAADYWNWYQLCRPESRQADAVSRASPWAVCSKHAWKHTQKCNFGHRWLVRDMWPYDLGKKKKKKRFCFFPGPNVHTPYLCYQKWGVMPGWWTDVCIRLRLLFFWLGTLRTWWSLYGIVNSPPVPHTRTHFSSSLLSSHQYL